MFTPLKLGDLPTLSHRVVLAPLTRQRSPETLPGPLLGEYYHQRASPGGLVITEATCVSLQGMGAMDVPGIWSDEQVARWQAITAGVRTKGGVFLCQLWHMGRVSHVCMHGIEPVAPSAVTFKGKTMSPQKQIVPYEIPRALDLDGIRDVIAQYAHAARNAIRAGFHGVEIHGANGYLIDQFLNDTSNQRTDAYGGSIANKARFALEVVDAVVAAVGTPRLVGIRLSPAFHGYGMGCNDPVGTWSYVLEQLNSRQLAFVHIIEPRTNGIVDHPNETRDFRSIWRRVYHGNIITAGGYSRTSGIEAIEQNPPVADAVAYGRFFIANPDLPFRFQHDLPLNQYDRSTFYGGGARGYTDYPFYHENDTETATTPAAVAAAKL